jgi:hypothetical protein
VGGHGETCSAAIQNGGGGCTGAVCHWNSPCLTGKSSVNDDKLIINGHFQKKTFK